MEKNDTVLVPQVGKLYVCRHNETRNGIREDFELIIFCTGVGVKSTWGNYKTISGVVIKQTDKFSSLPLGEYSQTWNIDRFEEYDGEITLSNSTWVEFKVCGGCSG